MSVRRWVSSVVAVVAALGVVGAVGGGHVQGVQVPEVKLPKVALPSGVELPSLGDTSPTPAAGPVGGQLEQLALTSAAPASAYTRDAFGQRWADVDRNGCDTRNDVLRRDLTQVQIKPGTRGCKVLSGQLVDPYSGATIPFSSQDSQAVQIDHTVSLADAWASGAWAWDESQRTAFANDPANLLAVDGPANTSKSDATAADWLPDTVAGRCELVEHQVVVKAKWGLSVTERERAAMRRVLASCPAG